jgi:TonB family protein
MLTRLTLAASFSAALCLHALVAAPAQDKPGAPIPPPETFGEDYDRVFTSREVTQQPVITRRPPPGVTDEALRNRVHGIVRLRAVLAKDGKVKDIRVIKGLPDGLTEKAIAAARKIKFRPARKDGRAVSMWITLEYKFAGY